MSSASKHRVKFSTLPKLMWGKFAYVVAIHNPNGSWVFRDQCSYRVGRISHRSLETLMNACPDDADIFKLIKRRNNSWKFYFVNKGQFDHFCEVVSRTCRFHMAEIMQPSDEEQVDTLRANGLIVYREHWFHNHYEWKVSFKDDLDETVSTEIQQWIHQTLADENDANRFKIRSTRHTLIFYLKHEEDVLMTKLTYAGDIKQVTRAIIAAPVVYTKNNNNKGNNNASSTLSQTP